MYYLKPIFCTEVVLKTYIIFNLYINNKLYFMYKGHEYRFLLDCHFVVNYERFLFNINTFYKITSKQFPN